MKTHQNIKIKSGIWNIFPFSKYTANAIYPNIYLPERVYNNLLSSNPEPQNIAILNHEETHIRRQKETGWIKWGIKYLIFPSFRFNEELEAIKSSMKHLKRNGVIFDTSKSAGYLSSWLYLWCASYDKAKEELDKAWKRA